MTRQLLFALTFCWFLIFNILGEECEKTIMKLPDLTDSSQWRVDPATKDKLNIIPLENWLRVGFTCKKDDVGKLLLKTPRPIPDWVTGMNFLATNNATSSGLRIYVIIRDSKNREYLYHTKPPHSYKYGLFFTEHTIHRKHESQFSVPGLKLTKLVPAAGATVTAIDTRTKPEKPLSLVGLYLEGYRHLKQNTKDAEFLFRDFALTGLSPKNTRLYYQFDDQEFYGEVAPAPYITPGQFMIWYGQQFNISWEVLDQYTGQPILAGGKSFNLETDNPENPLETQLAEHIEIPISTQGTYWVRVKLRWAKKADALPERISEYEYRLYIHKGKEKADFNVIPADTFIPNNYVRIAPARKSLIYNFDEKFIVPISFWKPERTYKNISCAIKVTRGKKGNVVKEMEKTPEWKTGVASVDCDLTTLPPSAYEITGTLLLDGKIFDKTTRLIGREDKPNSQGPNDDIPDCAPSWKSLLSRGTPLFHLCPILPDNDVRNRLQDAWDKYYKPFLDHASELSRDIEVQIPWKNVEPLPGVYDWSTIDRFIDYADRKRLQVLLYPEYRAGNTPEWLPSFYEENPEGEIFGHNTYLVHGARPNLLHAPAFRDRIMTFIGKMAERYRSHPGVQGYFSCLEHPGDAPYKGWYEGYSPESRKAFVAYCKSKWKTIDAVNKRWNTSFTSWDKIDHPRGDVSERFRLDWLQFRVNSTEEFLKDLVRTIRKLDKKRLIVIYGDGYHDLEWFRDNGCISANGGSHDTMGIPGYAESALRKYPQRTEDHSPGDWSAYFPTQMDASVFAMTAGGGACAHCKAYVKTQIPWQEYLGDYKKSLGRYKYFMPIWQELHDTECLPIETFTYNSIASYLIKAKTTYFGWYRSPWQLSSIMAAHIPVSNGPVELWRKGKLLMLTNDQSENLEEKTLNNILDYVKNGGTVLMYADAGRRCVEKPNEDWVMLKRFGFTPPVEDVLKNRMIAATPEVGAIFPSTAKPFILRDCWLCPLSQNENVAAYYAHGEKNVALSWKPFGKGKVAVIWARTIIPPMNSKDNYPFLRDIAKWAGVSLYSDASTPLFWTNLLKKKGRDIYYGLVHVGTWQNRPADTVSGSVRWLAVADGNYEVSELISKKKIGIMSADELRNKGISLSLNPREVAIYKLIKQEDGNDKN